MSKKIKQHHPSILKGNPGSAHKRVFVDGSTRSFITLRTAAVGHGTYQPGWRWSLHARPQTGKESENHIGYVISGRMMVRDPLGNEVEVGPGVAFELPASSDAWVIGEEPCIALDFIPIKTFANRPPKCDR